MSVFNFRERWRSIAVRGQGNQGVTDKTTSNTRRPKIPPDASAFSMDNRSYRYSVLQSPRSRVWLTGEQTLLGIGGVWLTSRLVGNV
jgi:hypothetical protein